MKKAERIQTIERMRFKKPINLFRDKNGKVYYTLPTEVATAIEEAIGVDKNRILKIIIKDILEFDYDTMTAKEYKEARIQFFKNRKEVAKAISTNKEVIKIREII